jgi:tetratricopeptide (TPR) repeat protein
MQQLSLTARHAIQKKDWRMAEACARELISRQRRDPEGYFLMGLVDKAASQTARSIRNFSKAIGLDGARYDAAVELAGQYVRLKQYGDAVKLLREYDDMLQNSPRYLDMAGTLYSNIGLPERAWPLFRRAADLQPDADSIRANLAACSVHVGRIEEARDIYRALLKKFPEHQRNHYELSKLDTARDSSHVDEMKRILDSTKQPAEKNIYLYYALGKELEDLERWDEAFEYYEKAGTAAASVANYDVAKDVRLIDKVIETCTAEWIAGDESRNDMNVVDKIPVFIVGLPRTGTTLTERILSSHSHVESIGETFFMQILLKQMSGVRTPDAMNAEIVAAAATCDVFNLGRRYLDAVAYKFGDKPMFIEKFPENILYLGFIARAFPSARIIHLVRNPMDACFALYKQSFFRYAYTLSDLGAYYLAYHDLSCHWREALGDRLIEVRYEDLVSDFDTETRQLLKALGLDFEEACLNFEQNRAASNTASSVQIRERAHTRSVNRWRRFERQLQALRNCLESGGVKVE